MGIKDQDVARMIELVRKNDKLRSSRSRPLRFFLLAEVAMAKVRKR